VLLAALQADEAPGQQQQQQPGQQQQQAQPSGQQPDLGAAAAAAAGDANTKPPTAAAAVRGAPPGAIAGAGSSSKSVKVVDYLNEAYERACQYVKRSGLEGQEQLQALQVSVVVMGCFVPSPTAMPSAAEGVLQTLVSAAGECLLQVRV
jgi:hypothetical protein